MEIEWLVLVLGSAGVGILSGLLGVGGGIVMVPFLFDGLGYELTTALSLSVMAGFLATSTATSQRLINPELRALIHVKYALAFGMGASAFAYLGAKSVSYFDLRVMRFLFIGLLSWMIWNTARKLWRERSSKASSSPEQSQPAAPSQQGSWLGWFTLAPLISGVGMLAGILAIGGGIVFGPVLHTLKGLNMRSASATSAAAVILTSIGSLTGYAPQLMQTDLKVVSGVVFGVIVGGIIGARLGGVLPMRVLAKLSLVLQVSVMSVHVVRLLQALA